MDILKAEIAKKRKALEQRGLIGPEKKFFKREELIRKEEEEYISKHEQRETAVSTESSRQPSSSPATDDSNSCSSDITPSQASITNSKEKILPRKEVIRRLRERGQPIMLFGESEYDAYKRLRALEVSEPEIIHGQRNDFQAAMDKVDQDYLNEIIKSGASSQGSSKASVSDVEFTSITIDVETLKSQAVNLGRNKNSNQEDRDLIHSYLTYLLQLWGQSLNARSEDEKQSTTGRKASAIYTQTQSYLKPLLKQLSNGKISSDILKHLIYIVKHMLDREYVKANDAYLQMAIGNAPWPIGVTMVGIHARTGREKIFAQNIAHVLNDETQRKYIQGLKRLMTQCQKIFPTDPSKCVEYNAIK